MNKKDQARTAVIAWVAEHKGISEADVTDDMIVDESAVRLSMSFLNVAIDLRNDRLTVSDLIGELENMLSLEDPFD